VSGDTSGSEVGERELEGTDCEEVEGPWFEGGTDKFEVLDGGKSLHGEIGFDELGR